MKSPLIATLTIAGVLLTGTAAIAVNSSAFTSVEQSRLGNQSALTTPQNPSTASLPARSPEPGETSTPAPDAGTPPMPAPEADSPTAGGQPEAQGSTGETVAPVSRPVPVAATAPGAPALPLPVPPKTVVVPAPKPTPTPTPAPKHRDEGQSNEGSGKSATEHDD